MIANEHTVIPFAPDWSFAIKYTRRRRTSLAEGVTGIEERAAFFSKPRSRFNYTITAEDGAGAFAVESVLRQALATAKAAVPLWARQQVIASVSGDRITMEVSTTLFKEGDWIGVAKPFGDVTAVGQIRLISGDNIYLEDAIAAAPGDLIMPILLGRIDSVPGELIGGAGRAFEIRFQSALPLEGINTQFVFTEIDTESNWLSFLANLYFLFFIDTSGSMDEDVPNVTAAAEDLKTMMRDMVYGGDQAQADHFVRIQNWSSERWLDRFAYKVSGEEAARYVSLAFINESSSSYHSVPRSGNEPTTSFTSDYASFQTEFARREYSRSKVYSINPTEANWVDDNLAFNAHLDEAITGQGNYASLGTPLIDQYVFHETGIPSGTTADEYLADIFDLLGIR